MPEVSIPSEALEAFKHLYRTTRMFLDLADYLGEGVTMVNTENLKDLSAAHQEVAKICGPSLHGLNSNQNQKGEINPEYHLFDDQRDYSLEVDN